MALQQTYQCCRHDLNQTIASTSSVQIIPEHEQQVLATDQNIPRQFGLGHVVSIQPDMIIVFALANATHSWKTRWNTSSTVTKEVRKLYAIV